MNREDYTNQHGAKVPTETTAINNILKDDETLFKARQLYGLFVRACCLCGYHLDDFTVTANNRTYHMQDLKRRDTNG